jgi:dolichyl-phosphate-mannose-protein mannosyltransferase
MVYLVSWTGWFFASNKFAYGRSYYLHPHQDWLSHEWGLFHGWWRYQRQIWHYSDHLTWDANPHPYLSRPYGWLLLARPVAYYYQAPKTCGASLCSQEVLGIGNPALWWATIPAFFAVAWAWIARRDWRAPAILVIFAAGYLPWFREDSAHRVMFLFYMLPNVPFMALAVTMAIGMALGRRRASTVRRSVGTGAVAVYLAAVIVMFGYFYPVLSGRTITYDQWHSRMWFHQCATKPNTHHENAPCWI